MHTEHTLIGFGIVLLEQICNYLDGNDIYFRPLHLVDEDLNELNEKLYFDDEDDSHHTMSSLYKRNYEKRLQELENIEDRIREKRLNG